MMKVVTGLFSFFLIANVGWGQVAFASDPAAQTLLAQSATLYARSGNFHFEAIKETRQHNELMDDRRKMIWTAIHGPEGKFLIDTRSPYGSWRQASDGKTEWIYWKDAKAYTQRPLGGGIPQFYRAYFGENSDLRTAWSIAINLEQMALKNVKAKQLPDETLTLGDSTFDCAVVQASARKRERGVSSDRTFWIEKSTHLFRKVTEHNQSYIVAGEVHTPFEEEVTTTYPVAELDAPAAETVFAFAPPNGVKLVDHLEPDWVRAIPAKPVVASGIPASVAPVPIVAVGSIAPNVRLVGEDGARQSLAAMKGKVVLLDFWATWCGGCLVSMPELKATAAKYRPAGVAVITVDEDQVRSEAKEYLERHGYDWTNVHDRRSVIQKAFGVEGIPQTIVVGRDGTIAFMASSVTSNSFGKDLAAALDRALTR